MPESVVLVLLPEEARRASARTAMGLAILGAGALVLAVASALGAESLGWAAPLAGVCPSFIAFALLASAGAAALRGRATVRVLVDGPRVCIEHLHPLRRRADLLPTGPVCVQARDHAVTLTSAGHTVYLSGLSRQQVASALDTLRRVLPAEPNATRSHPLAPDAQTPPQGRGPTTPGGR